MHAPRYVLTSYQKKLQEMDYEKHKKRLETIQKPSAKVAVKEKDKAWRSTFGEFRSKHIKFHINERIAEIDKDNQTLLNKLVKISRSQKPPLFDNTTMNNWTNPKTLNTYYRKRELEKIAHENESFAKRLISQNGSISVKRLDDDFSSHLCYKKQVQKVITSPKTVTTSPLKSPNSGDNEKVRAFKIKKKRKSKKIKTEMNQTIEPLQSSKVIIEPDFKTVATDGPEDEEGGTTAQKLYNTLPEHGNELENLTQEDKPEGLASKNSSQKELVESQALSSVNKLEAGEAETKSHEHIQPVKPTESQENSSNKMRNSRTLKPKRSDTVHLTTPTEVVKERSPKRKSFTNVLTMGDRKNSNPVVGSGGLGVLPKSQYANTTRTGRKDENAKSETARSLAKSQGLESGENNQGVASHNSQENVGGEGSNSNSQKNLEGQSSSVQENEKQEI